MNYAKPQFKATDINWAGKVIRAIASSKMPSTSDISKAISIIDNHRSSHSFPLNSFYMTLKRRAAKIDSSSIPSQRIKRLISIAVKLWDKNDMKLSQMQDIGGCRAVLSQPSEVIQLRDKYFSAPLTHTFVGEKDYITHPRTTGYRGIHLKYRFRGTGPSVHWDGLKIEIQLRTLLQHKWATAVESAGTFTKEALKSNQGRKEWLRFFALMSSVFALREGYPPVPDTPSTYAELVAEIKQINRDHHILNVFTQYNAIIPHIEKQKDAKYFLLTLDPTALTVEVEGFKGSQSQAANKAYTDAEAKLPKGSIIQIVLVSVSSISALKKAYPNYFLDTKDFLTEVEALIA